MVVFVSHLVQFRALYFTEVGNWTLVTDFMISWTLELVLLKWICLQSKTCMMLDIK